MQQQPQPVFFNTGPDPTGTQTRKGILNNFRRGARRRSCRARGTRRLEAVRIVETTTVSRTTGGPGGQAQLSWAQRSGGGTPPDRRTQQIRSLLRTSLDHGLDDYECRGRRKQASIRDSFVLPCGIDDWSHRTVPHDCIESFFLVGGGGSHGFPRHSLKILMLQLSLKTRPQSKPTLGGGGSGGGRGTTAIEPAP